MIDLAKLVVRLEAQSAQLLSELEKANRRIEKFASATSRTLKKWSSGLIGFFSGRFLLNFGKQVLQLEGELVGMAERAGTTVDRLSGLGFAADQSASSLDGLTKGLGNLADRAADAADKGGASAAAFEKIGVEVQKQDGTLKNSADLLLEIADQFAGYEDGAAKSALATDLFGKAGKELIPLLNRGAAGIEELTKRAEKLGITVGQDAAEAANEFNDQLNTLGAIARGVVGKALHDVLPILIGFNESLIEGEGAAERADKAARILAAGLKLLLSAGTIVGEIFDRVGSAIGATAAALVAVAEGEFNRAFEIIRESQNDTLESAADTGRELVAIWSSSADDIAKKVEEADARVKKTALFGGAKSELEEVRVVGASKIEKNAVEKFYDDLNEMTKTSSELAQAEYNKQREALELLYESGRISLEQYNERVAEAFDKFLPEFEVTVDKIKDKSKKALSDIDEFTKEAARNTQDIIAGGLKTALDQGISEGADGALKAFGDMLEQMALQAIAKNIAQYIFGEPGTEGDTGGLIGRFAGSFFGGARDSGGPGNAGVSYAIGVAAQPERFTPSEPGTFTPRKEWTAGGSTIGKLEQNIYVQGKADMRTARQMQIEANRRQRAAASRLG